MREYFLTLARYNVWATRRLFEHIDALSDTAYRRDAGLFFKSVHGTCNHLLLAEHRAKGVLVAGDDEVDGVDQGAVEVEDDDGAPRVAVLPSGVGALASTGVGHGGPA